MSKQSRARDKAFRAAAEHEAALRDYDRLSTAALEEWIKGYVDRHQETWTLIWKAANWWTNKWWAARQTDGLDHLRNRAQEQVTEAEERLRITRANLDGALSTAKHRLEKIRELEAELSELRGQNTEQAVLIQALEKKLELRTATLTAQRETGRMLDNENARLRDERTELQAQVPRRPDGDGWNLIWVRYNDFHDGMELPATVPATVPAPSRVQYGVTPCNHRWITDGYTHHCTEPKGHEYLVAGGHRCHCRSTR